MENMMTPADVAAVTRNNYGDYGFSGFGGDGLWLFAILALMGGGFGGWNRGNGFDGRCATVEDLADQSNFTRLESQVQANGNAITTAATNLGNGICSLGYQNARDFGNVIATVQGCCANGEKMTLENRYLAAQNTAAINENTTAQVQKVLDVISQNKIESLQGQISQLQLQNAMCGVVRYPNQITYNAGYPFAGGCGCNGNF